ncbi:calponin homology domain-containing protein DDB_G0272472-like [Palaemon carinicauda]|uniref:calponin homology domain-containing protein DDB_G0272472-like n=1 Tax=Palaemon carinicauda TaxID=392227 RepID=UPI0035B687A8
MPFNLQQFIVSPRDHVESLTVATKTDLKNLARHYDVQIPATAVKCVILSHILNFLVDEDIVPEEELADVRALTVTNPNSDLDKLSLQLELEKMKMQAATAAATAATAAAELEERKAAAAERAATAAAELEERKAAAAERKAAAAASLERIKVETALEQQEKASEQKNNALRVRLQIEREAATVTERDLAFIRLKEKEEGKLIPEPFDVGKVQKLLPTFEEREPDNYFSVFEDTAKNLNWPQDKWYLIIRNSFKGKALSVCATMLEEHDYFIIKQAILDAYSITAEGYSKYFVIVRSKFSRPF